MIAELCRLPILPKNFPQVLKMKSAVVWRSVNPGGCAGPIGILFLAKGRRKLSLLGVMAHEVSLV
jgi:hypothetical protein